jgi:cellulose synthase/poly-beta-1,6-N-acetylglucosamine synthase-like glycosyltransferase
VEIIITGIFWLAILLIVHAYILYPVSLWIFNWFKRKPEVVELLSYPSISIIISAYNEEKVIAERIDNIRNLNYDFNKLELIIGSDCSTDKTNEILNEKSQKNSWVRTKNFSTRRGKAAVLNDLVQLTKNEILVFTDANTKFEKDALLSLVSKFSDAKVGGVCGRLELEEPTDNFDKTNREKLYWKYETYLKNLEGDLGILIAANGGIYAIRKDLFIKFPDGEAITDDLYQTFAVLNQDYDFLYAFDATASEEVSKKIIMEFRRKVRFAATNFQTLKFFKCLLFRKNLLISYALWSHKIIRWFVPILLILLLVTNLFLINYSQLYYIIFIVQASFYISAFIGFVLNLLKVNIPFFSLIYYYMLTNLALLIGLFKFLSKKHAHAWDSTPR